MRSEELDTLFTNIADSIRTAEDSADPINVVDFPTRIASLSSGWIPSGFIGIWSGSSDNIPDGWALCDGTNGTPDLRGRFVLGSSTAHAIGSKGGEEKHTLTVAELANHAHNVSVSGTSATTTSGSSTKWLVMNSGTANRSTSSIGSSSPHNNMPPYYTLCYIMKL